MAAVLGTPAAYAFVRCNIPRERAWLLVVLGAQLLPAVLRIIPLFRLLRGTGLLDPLADPILAYSTFSLLFVVRIMASYFQGIPQELEEAAHIDGAHRWQASPM